MSDSHAAPSAGRFEIKVTADSHFGWIRTRLSIERTMMSWLRTATALIGFGFAIVQFFERLGQTPEARSAYLPDR
jgi:putative membrane protein